MNGIRFYEWPNLYTWFMSDGEVVSHLRKARVPAAGFQEFSALTSGSTWSPPKLTKIKENVNCIIFFTTVTFH